MMNTFLVIFGAAIFALAEAEVVQFQPCPYSKNTCTINELRISPCPEAAEGKACRVKKGTSASIAFDYTPNFQADIMKAQAYWGWLHFPGMNTNACDSTTCPVQANTMQTYNMSLPIAKWYPAASYDVKWKLWNKRQRRQECCLILKIELVE